MIVQMTQQQTQKQEVTIQDLGTCDYFVVGCGAASLAFLDTLLTELPDARIVILDRHPDPGGHWNDAYEYVQLHQPSMFYGVSSRQLEGNWMKLLLCQQMLPWNHRASRNEILCYYRTLVDEWIQNGHVRYFPHCEYEFSSNQENKEENNNNDDDNDDGLKKVQQHEFSSLDGSIRYRVKVAVKLVNGISGECRVPSQCPPEFPVDPSVHIITPNKLYDEYYSNSIQRQPQQHYVVLGAGKTGMDAVVFLQRTMNVDPATQITWVVPNDCWMLKREGKDSRPPVYYESLLRQNGNYEKACLDLEEQGSFVRLSRDIQPTRFRFPVVGGDELLLLQKVHKTTIRKGRVTGLYISQPDGEHVEMKFDSSNSFSVLFPKETIFVHCTSPGPFNGIAVKELFVSEDELKLQPIYAPPVPSSMSCLAKLEAARRNKTLDLEFGRMVCGLLQRQRRQPEKEDNIINNTNINDASTANNKNKNNSINGDSCNDGEDDQHFTENDILRLLFQPLNLDPVDCDVAKTTIAGKDTYRPLINEALFFALLDSNPKLGHEWMQSNRLSFLSIPGLKANTYDHIRRMVEHYPVLGFSEQDSAFLRLLAEKIRPLEGL